MADLSGPRPCNTRLENSRLSKTGSPDAATRGAPNARRGKPGAAGKCAVGTGVGKLGVIKKRRDFLALRSAAKAHSPGFLMAARRNPDNAPDEARLGLTVTKKLGGAVSRNRIRRRLRAAAREVFPAFAAPGVDYVLIARPPALRRDYRSLLDDMERALLRLGPALK